MNLFALSGILIATSSGLMSILMFALGKQRIHFLWGVFCIAVFTWGLGAFMIATSQDAAAADFWWRVTHIGVIFIPILFLHFVFVFLDLKRHITLLAYYAIGLLFAIATIQSDLMIANMRFVFEQFYYDSPPGLLYPVFTAFFFGTVIYSHAVLWRAYRRSSDTLLRTRILYFFLGMGLSFAGGSLSFLPVYEIDIYPVLNIAVFAYPLVVGYAIFKHKLFDIRVITTQLLVYLLWMFIILRTWFSDTKQDLLLNGGLLVATVFLGVFLIRNVQREIQTREEIETLARKLQKANARLKVLDKLKSEFVSIASHQLRSPLTSVRGYASMLLEGTYGKIPNKARLAIEKINDSSRFMALSIEDYLNVSRIQTGNMKYEATEFNIKKIVESVVDEMRAAGVKKGLLITFKTKTNCECVVKADIGKTRQIIQNLIDNAIKYTKKGSVTVTLKDQKNPKKIFIDITDTGVGMSEEALENIFGKFERARNANDVNVTGTGLGLYVAQKMAEDMGGTVTAQSEGEGEGSTFTFELPLIR